MTDGKFPNRLKDLWVDELVAISEAFDVSVNYLLVGDEMFPSLRQLKKKDADRILEKIEELKPEIG